MVKSISRKKILLILKWFENKFGISKYRLVYPKLRVYHSDGSSLDNDTFGRYGHFQNNTISIFLGSHDSVEELCYTVAHEYKHYLLCDDEWDMLYAKLKKRGLKHEKIIEVHPHEKKAEKFEKKWGGVCYIELKNKLYKR